MKRTLLIISLFFLGLSSKGQNLTFVDANNLVVTYGTSTSATWWKPNPGEVWKIEGINGNLWDNVSSNNKYVKINGSFGITHKINFPLWIGSNDSIQITPYPTSSGQAVINYLIFKNEP